MAARGRTRLRRKNLTLSDRFDIISLAVDIGVLDAVTLKPFLATVDGVKVADLVSKVLDIHITSPNLRTLLHNAEVAVDNFLKDPAP